MLTTNPLAKPTHFDELTPFDQIKPEHVGPAVRAGLASTEAALEKAVSPDVADDYHALSAVLDVATEHFNRLWGAVSHLNAVVDTPALRAAYNENLPAVTAFFTKLAADERLFRKYKRIAAADDAAPAARKLSAARRKGLDHALRDFVLSGAELQGEAKARYVAIQERLAALGQSYREHVLDATDRFVHFASPQELDGVPADVLEATKVSADDARKSGAAEGAVHKLTLQVPVYMPVMQYATNRALREKLHRAYVTRASDQSTMPEYDNAAAMKEILELRHEEAQLLGHATFAHVSLVPKMAPTPEHVLAFLQELASRAKPFAERDMQALREHATKHLGLTELKPWDMAFASEHFKEAAYAFSEQTVKQYFTEPTVLDGLFQIIERVFEVKVLKDMAPVWHPDVRFYRLERDGKLVAQFYLDAYARPGKQPGAWMGDERQRWLRPNGERQTPVATLTCNFAPPVGGKPSLLTHDDVITLFHEFGHGLHLMLTQVDDLSVSGLSGVEWDAIELPSQFMENFCWEWDVIRTLTAHVETGASLPRELFDKLLAAKNFQSGMQTMRQLEFGLSDMRLHTMPGAAANVRAIVDTVRAEVSVIPRIAENRFENSFSHIFAGGYAAGYYSYKWAEVLSADAWSAFEEEGTLSTATGRRLRLEIFERGGSRSAMENFKAFRGREPSLDALMRHQGMALPKVTSST